MFNINITWGKENASVTPPEIMQKAEHMRQKLRAKRGRFFLEKQNIVYVHRFL